MARITVEVTPNAMTPGQLGDEFQLLTDSQDIQPIIEYFNLNNAMRYYGEFNSFFVLIGDGDYDTVYASEYQFPPCNSPLYQIEMIYE